MSHFILTAEHIQKKYGNHIILNDISINLKQNEICGLIGKNASGKTTLFRILTGLIKEYYGAVYIDKKTRVSAMINSPSLFLNMTAFENLKAQAYLLGISDTNKIRQVLETVGLENQKHKLVKNFSLGMTQRLKLGVALLENPDILILDEPLNGLDPDGITELRELLLRLNRLNGTTILISSHILSELEQIATCFAILNNGEIVKEFSTQDIIQNRTTLEKIYIKYTRGGNKNA